MKKITVLINDNTLVFKYRTNKPIEPNLLNTNVISNNELVFSDEYLLTNSKIVGLFIYDLAKEKNITEVSVSNMEIAKLIMPIVKKMSSLECFTITDESTLLYSICEDIIKNKNIKKLNCYSIPQFMVEELDKHNVLVESRNEILFTSNFMANNSLTSFSKMYYKTNIKIGSILNNDDLEDFKTFCSINKYLKVIHFDSYSLDNIKKIVEILKDCKEKNITLQIHDDLEDIDDITELREYNKELKNKEKMKLTLSYSQDYLEKNYFYQVIFTTLKFCAIIIFAMVISVLGYIVFNNYTSELQVNEIKQELKEILNSDTSNEIIAPEEGKRPYINSYGKLVEVNPDMVGWISMSGSGVEIDYPIVKTVDNSYYLQRNFYGEQDYNGWVFMDYRNEIEELDANTIVYAHNRFTSGVMFGTLPKIRKNAWHQNKDNYNITFNTLYDKGTWKIFSYYGIDVTSDYLYTNFNSNDQHQEFIDMITKRSEYDFKTKVTIKDKILTLSTCLDNNQRFVVHAVLIPEEIEK